jgi:protein-L-isoaspartate(D-aspartate) O-methyltransferase
MADAALQRKNMVESQVRPSDVTDRRITAAMMAIAREKFVPANLASFAYSDENLSLGVGRVMLPPRVLAKLVQLADAEASDSVLVVGGSCGYAAALLARLAANVVALFPDEASSAAAKAAWAAVSVDNATAVAGPMTSGWPEKAPYDIILIEGGVEAVPDALTSELRDGGRLVTVAVDAGLGRAIVLHKQSGLATRRDAFQAAAPLLPGFEARRSAFVF